MIVSSYVTALRCDRRKRQAGLIVQDGIKGCNLHSSAYLTAVDVFCICSFPVVLQHGRLDDSPYMHARMMNI